MCRACPDTSRQRARPSMPVTRMLLRLVASQQGTVSAETLATLARNLQRAAHIVQSKDPAVAGAAAGNVLELAFELADEPELIARLHALTDPEQLDAPLATQVLAALDRFALA